MSYRMVVVGVVIILIPHIILGIVEIKFAVFGFWHCFCVERCLISLLPLFSVIAFLYGFFSLYLLYFFKQF